MMMLCVHFCAYYFAVGIPYFGYLNKISSYFLRV